MPNCQTAHKDSHKIQSDDHQAHDEASELDKSGQSKNGATSATVTTIFSGLLTTLIMLLVSKFIAS